MLDAEGLLAVAKPLVFASIGVLVGIGSNRLRARWIAVLVFLAIGVGVLMDVWPDLHAGQVTRTLRESADQLAVEIVIPIAVFFFVSFACGRYAGRVIHWAATRWERKRA